MTRVTRGGGESAARQAGTATYYEIKKNAMVSDVTVNHLTS